MNYKKDYNILNYFFALYPYIIWIIGILILFKILFIYDIVHRNSSIGVLY